MDVSLDFETFSEADLKKTGTWEYSVHESTCVICMAYSTDDGAVQLVTDAGEIHSILLNLVLEEGVVFKAWNSFFEYCITRNVLKISVPVTRFKDTMARAAARALPLSLGACASVLNLPQDKQKDKRGKDLINKLSKPQKGTRVRDPILEKEMGEYCVQDVVVERELSRILPELSEYERRVLELDQIINSRGVGIDIGSVMDALEMIRSVTIKLNDEVEDLTNGELQNVSQRAKVIAYCELQGFKLREYTAAYIENLLSPHDTQLPPKVRRLLEIRQQTGLTSLAKYNALSHIAPKGRAHGLFQYHAASTGRWGGRLFQPQNLPRGTITDTDTCISLFPYRNPEALEIFFGEPLGVLSSCVRGMICAPAGKKLIVSDYSSIEARVLAWVAGEESSLEVFRTGQDIYKHAAALIYRIPHERVDKKQRFIGKVATLALGYQGGANAFKRMAEDYGVEISSTLADEIKTNWRRANRKIVQFWYGVEEAAVSAVRNPGTVSSFRGIKYKSDNQFLLCKLPSGRTLAYHRPTLEKNRYGTDQINFWGMSSVSKAYCQQDTYGGKLTENIIQAISRDLLSFAMLNLEERGYPIVLHVHDEVVSEVNENFGSVEEFNSILCELPGWAFGLPIAAEGFEAKRYRK